MKENFEENRNGDFAEENVISNFTYEKFNNDLENSDTLESNDNNQISENDIIVDQIIRMSDEANSEKFRW